MKWNSRNVAADLQKINLVLAVHIQEPGGDVDTDNLLVEVRNCDDMFFVCGFDPENDPVNQSDCDVPFIQLTDGQDSRGGLNSDEENMGLVYLGIRKYFRDLGFDVVNTMDDYF
jgi:hypothetical protein